MLAPHHISATNRVRAAATGRVRDVVSGRVRTAVVVHVGRDAIYLDVGGFCLGVLTKSASAVPCGLHTTLPSLTDALGAGTRTVPGSTARVGGGALLLDGTDVVVGRLIDASVPALPAASAQRARRELSGRLRRLPDVCRELPDVALKLLGDGHESAVPLLLGRGGGLTPLGDDVLCGWLATVAAAARGGHHVEKSRAVAGAVTALAARHTTALSATLLDCAARGEALPQFRRLVRDLASGDDPGSSVSALLAVGHTSGSGMALGVSLALDLLVRSPTERTLV
ncbi:oxamate carbamoyltransferase subunit AllH family protein [Saccharomonospora xinjiangensis]|uniref:DUF2877 domain-containing protein n=1 Tax=Saccharomonospora xinjiangensis XJ-54 TaxID=882086 RepID=I0V790_9PSEU|nr:DUF2877 domain-containing protein [Saccharomonospora xinjiangensis]EID55993.1 Protein of unknown function (DUF2877) [Saccharomonospora xinjiangensis XJ-54]